MKNFRHSFSSTESFSLRWQCVLILLRPRYDLSKKKWKYSNFEFLESRQRERWWRRRKLTEFIKGKKYPRVKLLNIHLIGYHSSFSSSRKYSHSLFSSQRKFPRELRSSAWVSPTSALDFSIPLVFRLLYVRIFSSSVKSWTKKWSKWEPKKLNSTHRRWL